MRARNVAGWPLARSHIMYAVAEFELIFYIWLNKKECLYKSYFLTQQMQKQNVKLSFLVQKNTGSLRNFV